MPERSRGRMSENFFYPATKDLVDSLATVYATCPTVLKQLKDTPGRLARMYSEFCWNPDDIEEEISKQFRVFEDRFDEMLVTGPIVVWTLCPHHLLPVRLNIWVGYVPNGKVLGLSKFARIAIVMGKKPTMQETYTNELADLLLGRLQPKGVGVYAIGMHGCMTSRGVRQVSSIVTSSLRGCFLKEPATRAEFLSIVKEGSSNG